MWLVTNLTNSPILARYNERILTTLFEVLIEASKSTELVDSDYLTRQFVAHAYLDKKLLNINRSSTDKILPLMLDAMKLGSTKLEEEYAVFIEQNKEIDGGNYNLIEYNHPFELKQLFKNYFYDKFWGTAWLWTEIVGRDFNRADFHSSFKEENKMAVCPLCDTDTISNQRNSWVEHFLPKDKFPYLACNPKNLIPTCTACNVAGSGKGEDTKNPIETPYTRQIGDEIEFKIQNGEIEITLNSIHSIENYVELLKLRNRYKEKAVRASIFTVLKSTYNLILQSKQTNDFDADIFFQYIREIGKAKGFYFVQKGLLNDIKEIMEMPS